MLQIISALVIILFFISRTYWQKRKGTISKVEFYFWLIFWLSAAVLIVFIKRLDSFVSGLGFSASGINVLSYLSIAVIFYLIFKIVIRIEKIETNITKIVREVSLSSGNPDDKSKKPS